MTRRNAIVTRKQRRERKEKPRKVFIQEKSDRRKRKEKRIRRENIREKQIR